MNSWNMLLKRKGEKIKSQKKNIWRKCCHHKNTISILRFHADVDDKASEPYENLTQIQILEYTKTLGIGTVRPGELSLSGKR